MAKTRGPLLSLEARGKFGNSVLFQEGKSGSVARMMFKPKNKKTVFQQSNRSNITFGVNIWQSLSWFTKWIWEFVKDVKHLTMSGYNFFLSEYNISRNTGQPTKLYPDENLFSEYPIPNSLTEWWKMDEGIGNTITDYISNIVGTIIGATWTNGKIGKALYFDGAVGHVVTPLEFSTWPEKTIEGWYYFEQLKSWQIMIKEGDYSTIGSCGLITRIEGTVWLIQSYNNGASAFIVYGNVIPSFLNTWHHIVGVISRSGGYMKIYVDGVLADTYTDANITTSTFYNCSDTVRIGGSLNNLRGEKLKGKIDEIKIYNRVLTPAEVSHNYRIGS